MPPFLIVGTTLAAIVGGQTVGVAPEAQLKCIKVQKDGQEAEVKDIISGIQLAVERAGDNTTIPSVILVSYFLPANQELDDAVRIPTVSWNDTYTYIEMRFTGHQGHREGHPRHRSGRGR